MENAKNPGAIAYQNINIISNITTVVAGVLDKISGEEVSSSLADEPEHLAAVVGASIRRQVEQKG